MSAVVQRRDDLGAVEKHLQLRLERVRDDPFRVCGGVPEAAAEIVLPDEVLLRENAPVAVEHFERHRVDERRVLHAVGFPLVEHEQHGAVGPRAEYPLADHRRVVLMGHGHRYGLKTTGTERSGDRVRHVLGQWMRARSRHVERIAVTAPLESHEVGALVAAAHVLAFIMRRDRYRLGTGRLKDRHCLVVGVPVAGRASVTDHRCGQRPR